MKKILCMLLTVILFTSVSITVFGNDFPTYQFTIDDFTYEFSHGAIMPEFLVDDNSMLVILKYKGEKAVDINQFSNGLPKSLYFYQICEAAGLPKDEWFAPHWNEEVLVDDFITSIKTYDSNHKISVMATTATKGSQMIDFPDQTPIIVEDRTLLPIRAVAEYFGWGVSWIEETSHVEITSPEKKIRIEVNGINGNRIEKWDDAKGQYIFDSRLEVPAISVNGRTMLPVRAISESLNLRVDWNQTENCVILTN